MVRGTSAWLAALAIGLAVGAADDSATAAGIGACLALLVLQGLQRR